MDDNIAIKVDSVSKTFHEQSGARSFKEAFVNVGRKITGKKENRLHKGDFTALKNINFEIKKGEFFGIVGRNGSGKSTLLKIIAGIYTPTKGAVRVDGKLTPFIELGVGFNPELNGRDNVYLNASLLGFTRKQTDAMYNDIVDFAELKDFMDTKLKNYSSGMQVRLAFSVAIRAESDILLIDEVLAVGDAEFQRKCLNYFGMLKSNKQTVVFISHDMSSVRRYCDKAVFLDNGLIRKSGNPEKAIAGYSELFLEKDFSVEGKTGAKGQDLPVGMSPSAKIDRNRVRIKEVWVEDDYGNKTSRLGQESKNLNIKFIIESLDAIIGIVPGVVVRNPEGEFITASNSGWANIPRSLTFDSRGEKATVTFCIPNIYEQGEYDISINAVSSNLETFLAWKNKAVMIQVNNKHITGAKTFPRYEVWFEQ